MSQRFPKSYRICMQRDFDRVFKSGIVVSDAIIVVHAIANDLPYSRLGLSVSKRVGNAPTRNRWKRWFREAYRTQRSDLPVGFDFVVRPKKDAVGDFEKIRKSMQTLFAKIERRVSSG